MIEMSKENCLELKDTIEIKLNEADSLAEKTDYRFSHKEVFDKLRKQLNK